MPAYNFQPQFEEAIMADRKRHTIRAKRKRRPKVGDTCYLFVGMRQKGCRRLKARRGTRVQDILIYERGDGSLGVVIDKIELYPGEKESLALSDGFHSFAAMSAFWFVKHRAVHKTPLDFRGDLIHWESDEEHEKRIKVPDPFERKPRRARRPVKRIQAGRTKQK